MLRLLQTLLVERKMNEVRDETNLNNLLLKSYQIICLHTTNGILHYEQYFGIGYNRCNRREISFLGASSVTLNRSYLYV